MKNRAKTDVKKEQIIHRLLQAWKANPNLRLGQLLINSLPFSLSLFYVEDNELIDNVEASTYKHLINLNTQKGENHE